MKRRIIKAAALWLVLVVLLVALCVVTASGWVLAALCLCVLLPLVSFGLNFTLRGKLHLTLTLQTSTAKNAAMPVTAELRSSGFFPALRVLVPLEVRNDLTGESQRLELAMSAGANSSQTTAFLLGSACCGRLSVQAERVWLMDYFGFLPVSVPLTASARTTVLPDMFPSEVQLSPAASESDDGAEDRRGWDRSEVYQLREYRPGDDVRQIHWKLSSKLDELVWKEPSMPESRSLLVIWDKRVQAAPKEMDALAEAVSSVCQGITNDGLSFDLCWTEEEPCTRWIENEDQLLQAIPSMVSTAGAADCALPELREYGTVLYFGTQIPDDVMSDRVTCLLCGQAAGEDGRIVGFTPDNVQETLRRWEM